MSDEDTSSRSMRKLITGVCLSMAIIGGVSLRAAPLHAQHNGRLDIWAGETIYGPLLSGKLVVTRSSTNWKAKLSSVETQFHPAQDSVRFAFSSGTGEFRGALSRDRQSINGFWIQPNTLAAQSFASPLILRAERLGVWSGDVVPLDDRYTLYLLIWRTPDDTLHAAFRNPQTNDRGGSSVFIVSRVADSLVFTAGSDAAHPQVRRAAYVDSANRQMVMWWPEAGRYVVLTPRTPDEAVTLFPHLPLGARYLYSPPLPANDGWKSARARDAGMDEDRLTTLVQRIADTVVTLPRFPAVHSLLIAHKGKLVLEEYFEGFDRDQPHDSRSASKVFGSVMLGTLMMGGSNIGPESRVAQLVPALAPLANPDSRKQRITLANLLTHTSGLACDDNEDESPGNEGTMQSQTAQPSWWKYTLDLPMKHDPGEWYAYCSGGSNLVGAALSTVSRKWLPDLFDRTIASPLQFGRWYYNLMPNGDGYLGGGVYMRPRDFLKVAQVYLDGGVWNGRRIVPESWVSSSTKKQVEWEQRGENLSAGADALGWHLHTVQSGGRSYQEYEANGNGGQFLIVVPELDLAVVFTAGNYGGGGVWSRFRDDFLPNSIIPAIRK